MPCETNYIDQKRLGEVIDFIKQDIFFKFILNTLKTGQPGKIGQPFPEPTVGETGGAVHLKATLKNESIMSTDHEVAESKGLPVSSW